MTRKSVSLKKHIQHVESTLQDELDRRFAATEAIAVERTLGLSHRIDAGNKFRESLTDREKTYVTRVEHEELRRQVDKDGRRTAINTSLISLAVSLVTAIGAAFAVHLAGK